MVRIALSFGSLLLLAAPASVSAQPEEGPCGESTGRGPLLITPSDGGRSVTLGAQIRVQYSEGYFEDPAIAADPATAVTLVRCPLEADTCEDGVPVTGSAQAVGDVLVFTPDAPFESRTDYQGVAVGVDFNLPFTFHTGALFDTSPPTMGTIQDVRSEAVDPSCSAPDGGYRIDTVFTPAEDDGPPGDIEYLYYLTRGPLVEAPELRDRLRNFAATDTITMSFVLEPSEAVSPVCVTVYAIDGVGNIDDDTEPFCFDPIQGNFFEPACAAAPSERNAPFALLFIALPVALLWLRRRR